MTSYRLEMCTLGGAEGAGGDSGKGKGKVDPSFELAYLGPERSAGGQQHRGAAAGVCCLCQAGACAHALLTQHCAHPPTPCPPPPPPSAVVSDLEPGHRYSFRCAAINAQGSSGWGAVAQADTLPGLPYPVDPLHLVAATATTVKLRWGQPYGRGARVTGYTVEMAPTEEFEAAVEAQAAAAAPAAPGGGEGPAVQEEEQQGAPPVALEQEQQQPAANGVRAGSSSAASEAESGDPESLVQQVYQGADSACTGEPRASRAHAARVQI